MIILTVVQGKTSSRSKVGWSKYFDILRLVIAGSRSGLVDRWRRYPVTDVPEFAQIHPPKDQVHSIG
jgi:hypothetical protein